MRVAVTGASGFVGSALLPALPAAGHEAVRIRRGAFDAAVLAGADAVVHLAGENIGAGRWTPRRKEAIRESRVAGTRRLAAILAGLPRPPRALVCASAGGYYGDRGEEMLTEESGPGTGFLPEVCRAWEEAAAPAAAAGVRVVSLRIGMVLGAGGGALARLLPLFRLGLGGRLGGGRQWQSWISREDLVGIVLRTLEDGTLRGPVNAVAPNPVTNREFTETLARVLGRPAFLPVPAFALRLAAGEIADALLLSSARVVPAKLEAAGFGFRQPRLDEALRAALG